MELPACPESAPLARGNCRRVLRRRQAIRGRFALCGTTGGTLPEIHGPERLSCHPWRRTRDHESSRAPMCAFFLMISPIDTYTYVQSRLAYQGTTVRLTDSRIVFLILFIIYSSLLHWERSHCADRRDGGG
jgi:hypothetical protein